jgi:hypothetical protein
MLAGRLARLGLALHAGSLAAVLSPDAASASVPPSVLASTIKATGLLAAGLASGRAAALVGGVGQAMFAKRLGVGAAVLVVAATLGLGGIALAWRSQAAEGGPGSGRAAGSQPPAGKGEDNLRNTLLALEKHRWQAAEKGEWREEEKLLADDLVTVSGYGRHDKAANVEAVKHTRVTGWAMRDVEVRRVSKDAAIVTYVYDCKVLSAGGVLLQTRRNHRASDVWAMRRGGWVIIFCQETILPGVNEAACGPVAPPGSWSWESPTRRRRRKAADARRFREFAYRLIAGTGPAGAG